jgi:CBS domain containing-hemolysin-like protein
MLWLDLVYAIPIAALLVVLCALFAGTEVAVFSLRRTDREQMARSGRGTDKSVLALLAQPRRLITAVLLGMEAVTGLLVILVLGLAAHAWPALAARPVLLVAIAVGITLVIAVLFGEVMPKTFALKWPIAWSRASAVPLAVFTFVVTPLRIAIQAASALLLKPLGDVAKSRPSRDLSEEEFRSLVDAGSSQGQIDARERRLIHRVFDFADKNVGQIMTPRERLFALAYDLPMARLGKEVAARGFSRVPIYQKSVDNIRGILNAKDLVRAAAGQVGGRTLGELLHEPLFVPRTTPVKRLFLTFKQKKVHMGIVVNEYGKVLGLVTMDDVLAQLFGALRDERDALQTETKRDVPGRGGRTPVPGVPVLDGTGPVPRDASELTPPELTPPPAAVPEEIAAIAARLGPGRDGDGAGDGGDGPAPAGRLRASTKDEDDAGEASAAPVPVADIDTGPSGPVKAGRR